MYSKANLKIESLHKDTSKISLNGFFDEDFVFPDLSTIQSSNVLVNVKAFEGINSIAISNWIYWFQCEAEKHHFQFEDCTPTFLHTVNLVKNFLPSHSQIISLYAPFHCGDCDTTTNVKYNVDLLNYNEQTKRPIEVSEEITCQSCQGIAELDVVSPLYFAFMQRMKAAA